MRRVSAHPGGMQIVEVRPGSEVVGERVISVVVADDDPGFTDAVVDVLRADPRFSIVGTVATGEDLVDLVAEADPDVVLLDVQMPRGGPAAARALTRTGRGPVVVALSAQTGATHVLAMLRAGALGYLVKGRVGHDLPDLLVRCAHGDVVLSVPGAAEAMRQLSGSAAPRWSSAAVTTLP